MLLKEFDLKSQKVFESFRSCLLSSFFCISMQYYTIFRKSFVTKTLTNLGYNFHVITTKLLLHIFFRLWTRVISKKISESIECFSYLKIEELEVLKSSNICFIWFYSHFESINIQNFRSRSNFHIQTKTLIDSLGNVKLRKSTS